MHPLAGLDSNLLVALHVLPTHSSVTGAAEALGKTQPTMSRSLATPREAFGDVLLVRVGGATVLTPRAESLEAPLARLLQGIDRRPG